MLVVEAVERVGDLDRVVGQRVRATPLGRLGDDGRELGEPLDQFALLRRKRSSYQAGTWLGGGVAEDAGDPGMGVLDVVDRVLLGLLGGEVEVYLDRLVVAAVDEVPAGGVDADLADEVVEEDDVARALRHLRELAASDEVHELVEQDLDALGVVAEERRERLEPPLVGVVVRAEDVDRAVV